MKISKYRLQQIIKEEVGQFSRTHQLGEVASYVQEIFQSMRKKYGDTKLLEMFVDYLADAEVMDIFRFISKQQGERDVPLEPQPALEPAAPTGEEDTEDTRHFGATQKLRESK